MAPGMGSVGDPPGPEYVHSVKSMVSVTPTIYVEISLVIELELGLGESAASGMWMSQDNEESACSGMAVALIRGSWN